MITTRLDVVELFGCIFFMVIRKATQSWRILTLTTVNRQEPARSLKISREDHNMTDSQNKHIETSNKLSR